jgi:hypothetical protein
MAKATLYLWKTVEMTMDDLEIQKRYWRKLGFRVVVFIDGDADKDINEGMKAVIKNHRIF